MKAYTDVEQSKVLSEILPLESADMWWVALNWQETEYYVEVKQDGIIQPKNAVPCWSLAALLDALPPIQELCSSTDHYYRVHCMNLFSEWHENVIDTCYEMILRLYKKGLL